MQLEQITMDRNEARKAFLEYRASVREQHDPEDEQIMQGYRALARGQQLIRLSETIKAGGLREFIYDTKLWDGRLRRKSRMVPNIAVARANAKMCWTFGIDERGRIEIRTKYDINERNNRDRITVKGFTGEYPELAPRRETYSPDIRAIVPNVPPPLRPKVSLSNYHVLFEAEWGTDPLPPVDPALLKHVAGDLYAVVAVWDLTELERAVLGTRA